MPNSSLMLSSLDMTAPGARLRLLHTAGGVTGARFTSGGALSAGPRRVKVTLVIALLRNKLWAYPWMIAVLVAFIAYQVFLIVLSPTSGWIAPTVFDVLIVVLTWREHRKQRGIGFADTDSEGSVAKPTLAARLPGGIGGVDRCGRVPHRDALQPGIWLQHAQSHGGTGVARVPEAGHVVLRGPVRVDRGS
jgi:hypothetical protein